jgi:hypothetical protein
MPKFVFALDENLGVSKLRLDVVDVRDKRWPEETGNVLENHYLGTKFTDNLERGGELIALVGIAGVCAAEAERLTWWSTGDELDCASFAEFVERQSDVRFDDIGWLP